MESADLFVLGGGFFISGLLPCCAGSFKINGQEFLSGAFEDICLGHIMSLTLGFAMLTATLRLSKGVAWIYGILVKAIQVARPTAK